MSYQTWSTNGFGICVDDIFKDKSLTPKKFMELAAMEPSVLKIVQEYIDDICETDEITSDELTVDDFDELYGDYGEHGLSYILLNVITEIPVVFADDYDGVHYILYCPSYPWTMYDNERELSEEDVVQIFAKYVNILTDVPVKVDYYCVENGG